MTRIRYGGDPARPVWCSATTKDGRECGRKVGVSGAFCWQHRRAAERRRLAATDPPEERHE